jgi:uncharacterized protein YggU (UPF0235/DUF167 family)
VRPNAKTERIVAGAAGFELHVKAPPHEGKANAAACEALARCIGVPRSRVAVLRGSRSRDKLFAVDGLDEAQACARLSLAAAQ